MDRFTIRYNNYQYRNIEFIFVDEEKFNELKEDFKSWTVSSVPVLGESEHYRWWCKNAGLVDNKNSLLKPIPIEDKNFYYDGIYYVKK